MKTNYQRITYRNPDTNKSVTVLAMVEKDSSSFVMFSKVNKQGELYQHKQSKDGSWVDQVHVISASLITKRTPLKMNDKYGELESC